MNAERLKISNEEVKKWEKRKISFYDEQEKYNKSVIEILEIETIVMKMLRDTFIAKIQNIILENG